MKESIILSTLAIILLITGCKNEVAQWRGIARDGIYHETNLFDQWPEEGPELLWVYEGLGRGYAAPSVLGDKIFVNGEVEGQSYLFSLNREGELLWKSPNGEEFVGDGFSSTYPGARSTPTVFGKLVYTSSGEGRIACFEASTGEEQWGTSIVDYLDGEITYFGYSESVAVDDEKLFCFPGGPSKNFVALDRYTGKIAWTAAVHKDTFAYGSPVLVDLAEREILISTSRHHIFALDRNNGEVLGTYSLEGFEVDGEHCNSVLYRNGYIYFVSNDVKGPGAIKLELSKDGKEITEVWRNPDIRNNFGGYVVVNDQLFTTVKGNKLISLNSEDGSISDSLKVATGSIIYADNKFIVYGNNGSSNLIIYEGGKMELGSTFKIKEGTGHHFSHPVLNDGVMYIRHGDAIMAYAVSP